jgi:hypothetical protein
VIFFLPWYLEFLKFEGRDKGGRREGQGRNKGGRKEGGRRARWMPSMAVVAVSTGDFISSVLEGGLEFGGGREQT